MSLPVGPIPANVGIVDEQGLANVFFQLRWAEVRAAAAIVAAKGTLSRRVPSLNANLATVSLYTTLEAGLYRVSYYLRKVIADGAGSSLILTYGWLDNGTALTEPQAALLTDTAFAQQSGSKDLYADQGSDITIAVAYLSTNPGVMHYTIDAAVSQIK